MPTWKESIAVGEAAELERLAAKLRALQAARTPKGRALHRKSHAGLLGELRTHGDLPEWARVGIFSSPQTLRAYVRFSNGSGLAQSDRTPDVRGIAVKVVGVPGKKVIPGLEGAKTQDFLAILTPSIMFRTPTEFVEVVAAASGSPLLLLPRVLGALGLRAFSVLPKLQAGLKLKVESLASATFYSAVPIRWGEAAAKYSFAPLSVPEPAQPADGAGRERFALDLAARLSRGPIELALRVQPFVDEQSTPIEDPTVEWRSPWTTVATLTIPQQDLASERAKKIHDYVDSLSFDPWHATDELRPLGAIMRARAVAYRESVLERGAAAEPDGSESF